ncbi:MAG TPA: hypothetical protein VFM46_17595, partial [Pseudomonadales bacterium]|nr:hypothetical protein [Pseudomonadales bacterium]
MKKRIHILQCLVLFLLLVGCSQFGVGDTKTYDEAYGNPLPINRFVSTKSAVGLDYLNNVKPILEKRCVVCHACYDAPCQL